MTPGADALDARLQQALDGVRAVAEGCEIAIAAVVVTPEQASRRVVCCRGALWRSTGKKYRDSSHWRRLRMTRPWPRRCRTRRPCSWGYCNN